VVGIDEARRIVEAQIGPDNVILDEFTVAKPWGWVFFYNARAWLQGHDAPSGDDAKG
jgi:hypothetical protein